VYNALGCSVASKFSILKPAVLLAGARASNAGFTGNYKGDGWQLAGTFVMDADGTVVYSHLQQHFGDHAPPAEVLAAALQQPSGAKDDKPPPH